MTITEVREYPDALLPGHICKAFDIDIKDFWNVSRSGCSGVHESLFRSYHVVQKVKELAGKGTPSDVILELIREMEA